MDSRGAPPFMPASGELAMKRDLLHPRMLLRARAARTAPAAISAPRRARAWAIIAGAHAALAQACWGMVWAAWPPAHGEYPPCLVAVLPVPPPARLPLALQATPAVWLALEPPVSIPDGTLEPMDGPARCAGAGPAPEPAPPASSAPAIPLADLADLAATDAVGAAPGLGAGRVADGRQRLLARNGGSRGSDAAVHRALRWFTRHQGGNGMWAAERYQDRCDESSTCEPGSVGSCGGSAVDVALTGYALLCFLGAGYDHRTPDLHRAVIR
jgi:hypothetical protein